ncbi:MAG: Rieske (2Fe-2S) protein [Planctomycetota bacterium]
MATSDGEFKRRSFLSNCAMGGSLVGAYGVLGVYAGRYLYPAKGQARSWLFVTRARDLSVGEAIPFETPSGARVTVTRRAEGETADSFLALSSTCPHLGCKVLWEAQRKRFFCPCHNGVFNVDGSPREGPPAEANQSLLQYPLEVRDGLLFIEAAVEGLASNDDRTLAAGEDIVA